MIKLYSGTPGSGKSLHMARVIYNRIKYNKDVIANFEINSDAIKSKKKGKFVYIDNMQLSPIHLIKYAQEFWGDKKIIEGKLLLVIDECQILFNSRNWNQVNRNAWLSFFTQHRKFGYDIVLVTQFDRMIDRQIRSLIEYEDIHRKVNNYGLVGKILGFLCGGSLFVAVNMWYPMHERLSAEFFIAHKKYFSIYNTYKMFSVPG